MNKAKIKVGIIARPNLYKVRGGDTVQIDETANALKRLGVDVEILLNQQIHYEKYNIFHFFNIITPEDILGHVYKIQVPYLVSTIYVDYRESDLKNRIDLLGKLSKFLSRDSIEYIKTLAKFMLKGEKISTLRFFIKGHRASIKYIIKHSSKLLPNSENEINRLQRDYGIIKDYAVVPNGINTSIFKFTNNLEIERDIVLCVARFEPQKNQLNLIRALKNTSYKVTFIGAPAPNHLKYYQMCVSEANNHMEFIGFMPQNELIHFYRKAKVHVLASWFETTGLSSLEAGAMGCNLVISNRGDVKEYFMDDVEYCEPDNVESILEAVNMAWRKEINLKFIDRISMNFTWERAANVTLDVYNNVIKV